MPGVVVAERMGDEKKQKGWQFPANPLFSHEFGTP